MSSDEPAGKAWRYFAVVLLAIGTLGFGLMGLCGAHFTFVWPAVSLVSVPSLLIGAGLAWVCGRGIYKTLRHKNP